MTHPADQWAQLRVDLRRSRNARTGKIPMPVVPFVCAGPKHQCINFGRPKGYRVDSNSGALASFVARLALTSTLMLVVAVEHPPSVLINRDR